MRPADVGKLAARDADQEEQGRDAVASRELLVGGRHRRYQPAAPTEDLERAPLGLAADQVDDGIHLPDLLLEAPGPEIDHGARAESAHHLNIVRRRHRHGAHTRPAGELDRVGAHVPRRPLDDHRLAGLEPRMSNKACHAVTAMTGTEAAST